MARSFGLIALQAVNVLGHPAGMPCQSSRIAEDEVIMGFPATLETTNEHVLTVTNSTGGAVSTYTGEHSLSLTITLA